MLVVAALGGNALLRRGEPQNVDAQRRNLAVAAKALAPIARNHRLVITHGNGPQVGLLALRAGGSDGKPAPFPLDVLGAESEGMIGYMVEQSLANEMPEREIATLLTLVEVDPSDPAFAHPTKAIGPIYDEAEAGLLAARSAWSLVPDGRGFRRAVASPHPRRLRGLNVIKRLVDDGIIVICAGGGGVPVAVTPAGKLQGVEAVIDKDLTAALLAEEIGADALLLLTDVAAVWSRWPREEGKPLGRVTPQELRPLSFAAGSMRPKIEAACRFAEATGRTAVIGAMEQAEGMLNGTSGTIVRLAHAPDEASAGR